MRNLINVVQCLINKNLPLIKIIVLYFKLQLFDIINFLKAIIMETIRTPAVAGSFYPSNKAVLQQTIQTLLTQVPPIVAIPKAIIVPHAGYIYSGSVAATAYKALVKANISKVILLGPSHRVAMSSLAISPAKSFATPLGNIALDLEAIAKIKDLPQVIFSEQAHILEHSLEVQLPFLIETLGLDFTLVPITIGQVTPNVVATVLEALWGDNKTLIVVSSDLSHYLPYRICQDLDEKTAYAIEHFQEQAILYEQACGGVGIRGLLLAAKKHKLSIQRLALLNSGDTAGSKDKVVGYGAWGFY